MRIGPVLERILSAARVIVLEIRGFRRVDEGLKAPDFDFSIFFFFRALVSACRIRLHSSEALPIRSFSYSAATAQLHSVESTILIYFSFSVWK